MSLLHPRSHGGLLCALLLSGQTVAAAATGEYLRWDVYEKADCADADLIHSEILGRVDRKEVARIVDDEDTPDTIKFKKSGDNYVSERHYDSFAGSIFSIEPMEQAKGPTTCTKGDDASLTGTTALFGPLKDAWWGKVSLIEKPGYTLFLEFYASTDTDCSGDMLYSAHEYFLSGCQQDSESSSFRTSAYKFGIENDTFVKRMWSEGTWMSPVKSNCTNGNGTLTSGSPFYWSTHDGARYDGMPWTCGQKCTKYKPRVTCGSSAFCTDVELYYKAKCVEGAYDGGGGADVGSGSRAYVHAGVLIGLAAWAVGWAA